MNNIKRNVDFLSILKSSSPSQRKAILKTMSPDQLKCLCEICHNVLRGVLPVNVNKLRRYKKAMRDLASRSLSNKVKKSILIKQSGGFLPFLIPAVLSTVGGIVRKLIE